MHVICEICQNLGCDCWIEIKSRQTRHLRAADIEDAVNNAEMAMSDYFSEKFGPIEGDERLILNLHMPKNRSDNK